jgi:hypothetical protein
LAATSTFLYRHPKAPDLRVVIDRRTGMPVVEALANPLKPALLNSQGPEPRAQVPTKVHDFGIMNAGAHGAHEFEIQNVGAAPLELAVGATTCKCTVGGISKSRLVPGETGTVRMEWDTGSKRQGFEESATISTNDPLARQIEFSVTGKVRLRLGIDRPLISVTSTGPSDAIEAEVLVYSQTWTTFEIADVAGKLPGLSWKAETIDPARAPELQALAVQKVTLQFQQPVDQGVFNDSLRIEVRPTVLSKLEHVDLLVTGAARRRFAFYGAAIDDRGIIDLGTVPYGVGKKVKLVCKVRDSQTDLGSPTIVVHPPVLHAQLRPLSEGDAQGLYELEVELPAGVEPCQYLATPVGRLEIVTDHPRIGTVNLMVSFAVLPK